MEGFGFRVRAESFAGLLAVALEGARSASAEPWTQNGREYFPINIFDIAMLFKALGQP